MLLPETIRYLALQDVPAEIDWEVVMINNNSTDNTSEVATAEWAKYGLSVPFIIVNEPVPGLSAAREKGIASARYEYLIFCDDDNWLFPNYVKTVCEVLNNDGQIGVLGGQGIAKCEIEPPEEIAPFLTAYATGPQAPHSGDVTHTRTTVYGAGSTYRKSALIELKEKGFASYLSDRQGNVLTSGGDAELCWAVLLSGYKIWYDERLKFYHFLTKKRLTWKYLMRLEYGNGFSSVLHVPYYHYVSKSNRPKFKNTWWWRLLGGSGILAVQKYRLFKNGSINSSREFILSHIRLKGYLKGLWVFRKKYAELFKVLQKAEWIKRN